ncbi:hypothetical protein GLAREA_07390 [Glarea lozoyensis ATCC 20868]|uniref:Uncharacterized protein n=1 Tax=Glarea lozoyensis (strain ATCC 20868 / MF5171) TaxID=1116229 RepID=S3D163_GLAL2|nr:uncharacterized protein GLAREA_07390 [Glarea lozoyensis ATCC 20868]EPE32257.1 hypothetical protein GLAREA_07390 [Glarea lozoyensis ATCC 20868]
MFSYLRPHTRRTPSTPSSPAEHSQSFEPPIHPTDHGHPQRWQESISPEPVGVAPPLPYTSSNMTRIASGGRETVSVALDTSRQKTMEKEFRTHVWESSRPNSSSRDVHAYNNSQRIAPGTYQQPEPSGRPATANYMSSQQNKPPPSFHGDGGYQQGRQEQSHNTMMSSGFQNNGMPTGRRPTGARLPSPSPSNVSTFEPTPSRSGKARLNLLNPMSLLARRRTSHAIPPLAPEALISNKSKQPESLDFRIRGTVVHDFSAPRPRRNMSYGESRPEEHSGNTRSYQRSPMPDSNGADESSSARWSGGNHTPVFTENFEEEQYPAAGPHVRKADDITDLPLPRPPYAKGIQRPVDVNAATQSGVDSTTDRTSVVANTNSIPAPDRPPPVPPKMGEQAYPQNKRISIDAPMPLPKSSVSSYKGRPRKVSEVSIKSIKDAAIPKHMKSTSSRFSFDMIGAAEQERLLEDRHRQRALEKQNERGNDDDNYGGFDDEYDYDGMDDDDGLEERIPGVNADYDDEDDAEDFPAEEEVPLVGVDEEKEDFPAEEEVPLVGDDGIGDYPVEEEVPIVGEDDSKETPTDTVENLGGFTFQQSWHTPLSPSSPGMPDTPRDGNGEVIGFAMTRNSPYVPSAPTPISAISTSSGVVEQHPPSKILEPQGLGLEGIATEAPRHPVIEDILDERYSANDISPSSPFYKDGDDDLYFDDGIITGLGNDEEIPEFDESVFDKLDTDQYGRPLKPFSPETTLYSPPTVSPSRTTSHLGRQPQEDDNSIAKALYPCYSLQNNVSAPQGTIRRLPAQLAEEEPSQGLTQDSLEAYQSALAAAAFKAVANGKFRRESTPSHPVQSDLEDTQPGLMTDSNQTSHYEPFSPNYELEDDFDYDDALEDDDIIAAANAEALAYDADGFYGQEFGFYSAPAASEGEYVNGGYFGPRGGDGLNRAQSGRIVVREPNLTPITERSEYSNRNSFMSLLMSPSLHGSGPVSSPGLAQLAGMMSAQDYEGGDMSLNALLKLRRGAWGGSQASLHSSTGSPKSAGGPDDINPASHPPWTQAGSSSSTAYASQGHRRKNSAISAISEATSGNDQLNPNDSVPGSPTLTMNTAGFNNARKDPEYESDDKENEPLSFGRHKHSASAESISYLKEEDPIAGQRWILERRRTAESGEVEVLGREVVQGGRI